MPRSSRRSWQGSRLDWLPCPARRTPVATQAAQRQRQQQQQGQRQQEGQDQEPGQGQQPDAAQERPSPPRIFSKQELATFSGEGGSALYLAILGDVFDVSSKPQFYAKDAGGYSHFVGADGSRAFSTGEFNGPVRPQVLDLDPMEVTGIVGWRDFYFRTYPYVGRMEGLYYTTAGDPTPELAAVEERAREGVRVREEKAREAAQYTSCSMRITAAEGGKVWCEEGHYPRKLLKDPEGAPDEFRCVCMGDIGWSDLLQVYPDCSPEDRECVTSPPHEPDTV